LILYKWPVAFYQLLDNLRQKQVGQKSKTRNRVFGLIQGNHEMLLESPEFMRMAYIKWIRSNARQSSYFSGREFCADNHLYLYGEHNDKQKAYPGDMPPEITGEAWDGIKGLFRFPEKTVGSGNLHNRAVERAQIFAGSYLYKLYTGCSWQQVPAVTKGLIKPGGLQQRMSVLKKLGRLKPITKALLDLIFY
jgi:hypothetical protein